MTTPNPRTSLAGEVAAVEAAVAKCEGGSNRTTRATVATDIYDKPPPTNGGKDTKKVIGTLKANQQTQLISCRADKWCQVTQGWVWGEHIKPGAN